MSDTTTARLEALLDLSDSDVLTHDWDTAPGDVQILQGSKRRMEMLGTSDARAFADAMCVALVTKPALDTSKLDVTLFTQSFVDAEKSRNYHDLVQQHIMTSAHGLAGVLLVLPPLLLCAGEDVQVKMKDGLLLMCFFDGPIIPVIEKEKLTTLRDTLHHLYTVANSSIRRLTSENAASVLRLV